MIYIGDKPILRYNIELLAAAGFTDVTINLHYRPEAIRSYFGDGSAYGVNIRYALEPQLLGTAGAVANVAEWLRHEDVFAIVYGDNLSTIDLRKLLDVHREKSADVTIALYRREDPRQSGIVGLDAQDRIVRFLEKPKEEDIFSDLVSAGYMIATPALFEAIASDRPLDLGCDVFPRMLADGARMYGYRMPEALWWIDSPEDYEATKAAFAAGVGRR